MAGTLYGTFNYVYSVTHCQLLCQKIYWCVSFNFHKHYQYCLLYKTIVADAQVDPYFITGPRTCGNTGGEFCNFSVNM
jgi:hypothetical protein